MTKPCLNIEKLYELDMQDRELAIDYIFDNVDDALWNGHDSQSWPDINALLEQIDIKRLSPESNVSLLSITLPVKNKLSSRAILVSKIREHWKQNMSEERINNILRNLE